MDTKARRALAHTLRLHSDELRVGNHADFADKVELSRDLDTVFPRTPTAPRIVTLSGIRLYNPPPCCRYPRQHADEWYVTFPGKDEVILGDLASAIVPELMDALIDYLLK